MAKLQARRWIVPRALCVVLTDEELVTDMHDGHKLLLTVVTLCYPFIMYVCM